MVKQTSRPVCQTKNREECERKERIITFKEGNLRIPKWNRKVFSVVAGGTTAYRKYFPEYKLEELAMMAFKNMLEDNDLRMDPLEVKGIISFATNGEFADHFQDQLLREAEVHDYLGLDPLHNTGIKTGVRRTVYGSRRGPIAWTAIPK